MLNAEKYRDEILEFISKKGTMYFSFKKDNVNKFGQCCETNCDYCSLYSENSTKEPCTIKRIKWLLSEYKEPVKLTKLEYELLKFWNSKKYKYIARDSNNAVFVYHEKPSKKSEVWGSIYEHRIVEEFDKLFLFVRWEDSTPTLIEEILDNCEVIEDASN